MAARMPANAPADAEAQAYWEAASAVLSWPDSPGRVARVASLRTQLRVLLRGEATRVADSPQDREDAPLLALREVASGADPAARFESTAAFGEAIAGARCAQEAQESADELTDMLAYVRGAIVPSSMPALHVDRVATRERLSFIVLLMEPNRLPDMRAMFQAFRSVYSISYAKHHERYWKKAGELIQAAETLAPAVAALQRLNALDRLGPRLGEVAIVAYTDLQLLIPCAGAAPEAQLEQAPVCASCGVTLADEPPAEQLATAARDVRDALAAQQRRLASAAIQRILRRGGERLDRFVELVQAADTASLALVLDDQLVAFLQDLLAEPAAPPSFLAATP